MAVGAGRAATERSEGAAILEVFVSSLGEVVTIVLSRSSFAQMFSASASVCVTSSCVVVLVISRLPNATCIMKSELWDNLFLGAGARWAGYIRNDSPRSMIRLAVEDIQRDGHLLVFPEGTRTVTSPVNPLRGSFAVIARRAQVPIQIVFIETNSRFLGKGWPLWRRPEFPLRYRVRLGPRLSAQGNTESITEQVAACFESELGPLAARRSDVAPMMDSTVDA